MNLPSILAGADRAACPNNEERRGEGIVGDYENVGGRNGAEGGSVGRVRPDTYDNVKHQFMAPFWRP